MPQIYHEKQLRELCALHALNNLFQARDTFTKAQLDEICKQLSPDEWINPHRSVLGLGNYDINVIMTALQKRGYEAIWFDKRRDPSCINLNEIFGFILNVPTEYKLGYLVLPLKRRHWIAVRKISNNNDNDNLNDLNQHHNYYNLDSKLDSPQLIGDKENLLNYLRQQLRSKDKELFIIVKYDINGKTNNWLKITTESSSSS